MTDKQYEKFRQSGKKIYKVWLKGKRFHKALMPFEDFDNSPNMRGWLNSVNVCDINHPIDVRFVTEDQLTNQLIQYHKAIRSEIVHEIKELQNKLDKLNEAIYSATCRPVISHE